MKQFLILTLLFLLVFGCKNDNNIVFPDTSLLLDDVPVSLENFYAVKNENRVVLFFEEKSKDHLIIKFHDLEDGFEGDLSLSDDINSHLYQFDNHKILRSCSGPIITGNVSCITPSSIKIDSYDGIGKIQGSFDLGFQLRPNSNDTLHSAKGQFNLPIKEINYENKFSVLMNGNEFEITNSNFKTNYWRFIHITEGAGIQISGSNTINSSLVSLSLPFNIAEGEYPIESHPVIIGSTISPNSLEEPKGYVMLESTTVDYNGILTITNHIPEERIIKGNATLEVDGDTLQINFEGFYF